MIVEAIKKVTSGLDLSEEEMGRVMEIITASEATPAQIGAFLVGLRLKGESVNEITGAVRVLRDRCRPLAGLGRNLGSLVDTCGTGGDETGTFNVSTAAALVAAGAGVRVAKHGNRAVSSGCGSADVLEELGVDLEMSPEEAGGCLDRIGVAFLFAPLFHPSMGAVAGPRREIKLRTIFNLLGPLANPAQAQAQVVGVFRADLTETLGRVLRRLGCRSAYVVHGSDGCDEITVTGPTQVTRLRQGELETFTIGPEQFGFPRADPKEIKGGTPAQNARIVLEVLEGRPGPCRDMVLLNAAAALSAAGRAESIERGLTPAARSIDQGWALEKLNLLAAAGHGERKQSLKGAA